MTIALFLYLGNKDIEKNLANSDFYQDSKYGKINNWPDSKLGHTNKKRIRRPSAMVTAKIKN